MTFFTKKLFLFLIQSTLIFNVNAANIRKNGNIVVYGEDERYDLHKLPNSIPSKRQTKLNQWSKSLAAMVSTDNMQQGSYELFFTLEANTLKEEMNVCKEEKFAEQITAASCTGFLVAPDLIVTAGHCVDSKYACEMNAWVFGYQAEQVLSSSKAPFIWKKDVYYCSEIVARHYKSKSQKSGVDYALVRLDRVVSDREPLKIRSKGKIQEKATLVALGYPSGLPLKIADNGTIRENKNPEFFVANIDTFHGNSGSPVINWETGLVEGILVRGDSDYVFDDEKNCYKTHQCKQDECRGEDVVRTTIMRELL